jgi:hypothetical protein
VERSKGKKWFFRFEPPFVDSLLLFPSLQFLSSFLCLDKRLLSFFCSFFLCLCRLLSFLGQSSINAADKLHSRIFALLASDWITSIPFVAYRQKYTASASYSSGSVILVVPVLCTQLTNGIFHQLRPWIPVSLQFLPYPNVQTRQALSSSPTAQRLFDRPLGPT